MRFQAVIRGSSTIEDFSTQAMSAYAAYKAFEDHQT